MQSDQTSYRNIMKATSLFGGVQLMQIIFSIVRSKFVAILLGPLGMGIMKILNTGTGLIAGITGLGLRTSAIKNIAEANGTGDTLKTATIVRVVRILVWATGLLGAFTTLILAPWLSKITFGNHDYSAAFIWISITLLFNQITTGQLVLLQGLRKLKLLAKGSLLGAFLGLIISIPIYYKWRVDGIVPAIIVSSIISLIVAIFFSKKIKIEKVSISLKTLKDEGQGILKMGFVIALTGHLDQLIEFTTAAFISRYGSIETVGLYSAGFAIVYKYTDLIFTAMLTDYYPRLSAVSNNNTLCKIEINQQAEISVLILGPLILAFMVFVKFAIVLLYSRKFLAVDVMMVWAILGIFFKALDWSVGIIFLAKGEGKLYLSIYVLATIIVLLSNLGGFYFFGLSGMGIAFLVSHLSLAIIGFWIARVKYFFSYTPELIKIFIIQFTLGLVCFIMVLTIKNDFIYLVGGGLILISILHSYRELNKRIDISNIIKNIRNKNTKENKS